MNPIDDTEELPLFAVNLDAIPALDKQNYYRRMDGTGYNLKYIRSSDARSVQAYTDEIASGVVNVLGIDENGEDETVADRRAAEAEAAGMQSKVMGMVDVQWAAYLKGLKDGEDAKLKKMQDALNAAYQRKVDSSRR